MDDFHEVTIALGKILLKILHVITNLREMIK